MVKHHQLNRDFSVKIVKQAGVLENQEEFLKREYLKSLRIGLLILSPLILSLAIFSRSPSRNYYLMANLGGVLLIDADYFGRYNCLIVYRNYPFGINVFYRWAQGEFKNEILADLCFLVNNGYPLRGVVSDWKRAIVSVVQIVSQKYAHKLNLKHPLPHQRCLVHVQLSCQGWLTQKPKTEAGQNLLQLVHLLNEVKSQSEKNILHLWFKRFEKQYGRFAQEKTYSYNEQGKKIWWYTHKYLRRTFVLLKRNWENLFVYLDYDYLSKDANGLEGFFSQLDGAVSRHRGLKRTRLSHFLYWYLFLKQFPHLRLQDIKKLRL